MRRGAITAALLCGGAFACAIGVLPPLLPAMAESFALSEVATAWIVSVHALARLAVDLPAGVVLERVGPRRTFVGGGLLVVASGLLPALAQAPWVVYAARALGGVGHALASLALLLFVMAVSAPDARPRTGSLSEFTVIASLLVIGLVAGPVASALDWRAALALTGLLAAGATLMGARLPWGAAAPRAGGGEAPATPAEVAAAPAPIGPVLAAAFSLPLTWHGVLVTLVPLTAATRLGLDATGIGRVLALGYAADLIGLALIATLGGRHAGWRLVTAALALLAAAAPAVLLAPSPGLLGAAVLVLGVAFAVWMIPAVLLLGAVAPSRHVRTLAAFRFVGDGAAVLGPVLMAAVYQQGGAPAAAAFAVLAPLGAALAMARGARAVAGDAAGRHRVRSKASREG